MSPVLVMERVSRRYRTAFRRMVTAVDDVSLTVQDGEILGLTGETGAGKSTVARLAAGLEAPDTGWIGWNTERKPVPRWRRAQMIFQDPVAALNPHMVIGDAIAEPLVVAGIQDAGDRRQRVEAVCRQVSLPLDTLDRLPETLSGGELQRACIARALAVSPRLLVADEPVSSLDAPVRIEVLSLLKQLVKQEGIGLMLITHDLAAAGSVADRLAVMLGGMVVEEGPAPVLAKQAAHPYTRDLLGLTSGRHVRPSDEPGFPGPSGAGICPFRDRCPEARAACFRLRPDWVTVSPSHRVRCFARLEGPGRSGTMAP